MPAAECRTRGAAPSLPFMPRPLSAEDWEFLGGHPSSARRAHPVMPRRIEGAGARPDPTLRFLLLAATVLALLLLPVISAH